ncbi:hypothetical protein GJ744_009839 [Endocarpon pusillum]|uniref:Uncharacterized protein n=1 Tax=Endocarpon pusillum TaxID=364733 RepID=A0A8H7E9P4_9EURO|nr:hypothetical protein GJ744_009839 [Endocarpon pusillum]
MDHGGIDGTITSSNSGELAHVVFVERNVRIDKVTKALQTGRFNVRLPKGCHLRREARA